MTVLDVSPDPSRSIASRKDFDGDGAHRFAFSVQTTVRTLDLIAPNEEAYRYFCVHAFFSNSYNFLRLWVIGLQCLLTFGEQLLEQPAGFKVANFNTMLTTLNSKIPQGFNEEQ